MESGTGSALAARTPPRDLAIANPITIALNSQFGDYAAQGDGTPGNPYIIEGYSININETGYTNCISVTNTDAHFIIRSCDFTGRSYTAEYDPSVTVVEGILLQFQAVRNGLVEDCTFTTFAMAAEILGCESVTVKSCTMTGMEYPSPDPYPYGSGVHLTELSKHCVVTANSITDCSPGIGLYNNVSDIAIDANTISGCDTAIVSYRWCLNNTITNNQCSNCDTGISLTASNNTLIANNSCSSNKLLGIGVDSESTNNTLVFNTLLSNGVGMTSTDVSTTYVPPDLGAGLYVGGANNNITMNDLVSNGVNCRNDGGGNAYDYNYWSDYTGTDSNSDGIGDTPYAIQGDHQSEDPHPRMSRLSGAHSTTTLPLDAITLIAVAGVAIVVVLGVVFLRKH